MFSIHLSIAKFVLCLWQMKYWCAARKKWCWYRKIEVQAGCFVPSLTVVPKTKHGLIWHRILTFQMKRDRDFLNHYTTTEFFSSLANCEENKFPVDQSATESVASISQLSGIYYERSKHPAWGNLEIWGKAYRHLRKWNLRYVSVNETWSNS